MANNHCSTRYEQSFRHNKHTHTNQKAATDKHSRQIIKFIANYIKGRKAYTTYRNHTSKQRQFKTGVPQGGVLSPTLFNIYTSDLPPPSAPVQVMAYADDITITSTHTSTSSAKKYIQPYLHKVFAWTKQNNLLVNPDKTTCHSVHTRPCRIYEQSGPNNKQQSTTHGNAPKGSGSYLRPKTHIQHTHPQHLSTSTQTSTNHLHKVDAKTHPSPLCPLCNIHTHDTHHLFNCTHIRTTLSPLDLWTDPAGVTALPARWTEKLAGGPQAGTSDSPPPLARAMGVGRQQQH